MSKRIIYNLFNCLVILSSIFCSLTWAATIKVDTTVDDQTANGNCTLREAICAAELNTAVDNCAAGDDNSDTIDLTSVNGTITFAAELLPITKDLTITGPGSSSLTVDGNGISSVFYISSLTGDQTLTISGLTVTGGDDINIGGGFLVAPGDTLNLSSCVIDNNRAPLGGGIFNNGGTVTLTDCTVRNNTATISGGGMDNRGTMTVKESLVNANTAVAFNGAGINNDGTLTLVNSTVNGNKSGAWAGGIFNNGTMILNNSLVNANSDGLGVGGIIQQGIATFINSTISGNVGIGVQNTNAIGVNSTFNNSTIAFNGGIGYAHAQTTTIYSTIVANNNTNCSGTEWDTFIDAGWNLDSDDTCGFTDFTDLPNTDPFLGPLQDNGGTTKTHALQTGSPAVDASDNMRCPATDQRGVTRPQDGDGDGKAVCDIGAYELFLSKATPWIPFLLLED